MDFRPLFITLQLAVISTVILLLVSIPLAWWLAKGNSFFKHLIEALVTLPLVLPPTVLGFYLLIALGPEGIIGKPLELLKIGHLAFSFKGLVIGSVIFSLPFAVRPIQSAFELIDPHILEAAFTLKASPFDRFFSVILPSAFPGILTGGILAFAHVIGEFGVVLMIGGSIPGKTQVLSTAIYNHVEAMEYMQVHLLSAVLLLFSFLVLVSIAFIKRRYQKVISI